MHCGRMRTARSLLYSGVFMQGISVHGVSIHQDRDPPGQRPPPPVNRMTDSSKNIAFLQTLFAGGNEPQK